MIVPITIAIGYFTGRLLMACGCPKKSLRKLALALMLSGAVGFVLVEVVYAAEFPVSDQDQGNIAFLCETAARSPNIPIEQVATVAQFCVQWKARVKAAGEVVKTAPETPTK